jgi:hypothetical protein
MVSPNSCYERQGRIELFAHQRVEGWDAWVTRWSQRMESEPRWVSRISGLGRVFEVRPTPRPILVVFHSRRGQSKTGASEY